MTSSISLKISSGRDIAVFIPLIIHLGITDVNTDSIGRVETAWHGDYNHNSKTTLNVECKAHEACFFTSGEYQRLGG